MKKSHYLAFDIGASSGRAILGTLKEGEVSLEEIHRFTNEMTFKNGHFHWDINHLFNELKKGLKKCIHDNKITPDSISIDTWGVDFGFLDEDGNIIGLPFAYRDSISDKAMDEVFEIIPAEELYAITGIQFMKFNSIFQLWAINKKYPDLIQKAKKLLFMPDLLGYMFTGKTWSEQTIASTSQMIDPNTNKWLFGLLDKLNLPGDILQGTISPGTIMANILPEIQEEIGCPEIPFVASCAHDTGAAIVSIPSKGSDWVYISSGTWSLMGMEFDKPVLNQKAFQSSFTNEGGFDSSIRFLKNITGLWLLQECKKIWDKERSLSFSELVEISKNVKAFKHLVDPDHPDFMNPENMVQAIDNFCYETGQGKPSSIAEYARCIFESLALKYKYTLDLLLEAKPSKPEKIHVIGGGSKNELLCQYTANATGLPVISGPTEGAALGNILVQAYASGEIKSLKEIRQIASNSVETKTFIPEDEDTWNQAYLHWKKIVL